MIVWEERMERKGGGDVTGRRWSLRGGEEQGIVFGAKAEGGGVVLSIISSFKTWSPVLLIGLM
jgi:hypothetical protein